MVQGYSYSGSPDIAIDRRPKLLMHTFLMPGAIACCQLPSCLFNYSLNPSPKGPRQDGTGETTAVSQSRTFYVTDGDLQILVLLFCCDMQWSDKYRC
jgi:hypothetical protein